jgi:hypothetical protein
MAGQNVSTKEKQSNLYNYEHVDHYDRYYGSELHHSADVAEPIQQVFESGSS